jgi:hypothetical protein
MWAKTRILSSFPSHPAPETVGCVALFDAPFADRRPGALKNATHPIRDFKGTPLDYLSTTRTQVAADDSGSHVRPELLSRQLS